MRSVFIAATLALGALAFAPTAPAAESATCVDLAVESTIVPVPLTPASEDPTDPCPGIRPGGALIVRAGPFELFYCTLAFLLSDGTSTYVATAGHCVDPELGVPGPGERVSAHGVPGTFGEVAYQWCEGGDATGRGCAVGHDFGLIRIDDDKLVYASAAMCKWGAPSSGVFTDRGSDLLTVQHFGWGLLLGDASGGFGVPNPATQAREGTHFSSPEDENWTIVNTVAAPGDSGSGVLVGTFDLLPLSPLGAPQALGVLTHISVVPGIVFAQRLDVSIAKASQDLGVTLSLVTS